MGVQAFTDNGQFGNLPFYSPQDVARALNDIHSYVSSQKMVIANLSARKESQDDLEAQRKEIDSLKAHLSAKQKEKMHLQEEIYTMQQQVQKKYEDTVVAVKDFF